MINAHIEPQIIKFEDKPAFAVLPWDVYHELVKNYVPDESDIWFPHEVVEANVLKGDNLLKSWREYLGLPQSEAAMRAGMSQFEYAELEDQKSNPQMKTLEKLAKAFGISIEQLIE